MKQESIVRPEVFKNFRARQVVYIPLATPRRSLLGRLQKRAIRKKPLGCCSLYHLGDKVVLYGAVGAPLGILGLESLIASGAREVILLSFCGSLNPRFAIGDVASVERAYPDEGTSRHYLPGRGVFWPSSRLRHKIETILRENDLPVREGRLVSTDAPYRETRSWLAKKQKRGIELVDMEASAVLALAEFYKIEAAALMVVSDELFSGTWREGLPAPVLEKRIRDYFYPFL